MSFRNWIVNRYAEMASFSLRNRRFTIPCRFIHMSGMPCKEEEVYALDMRFEDPGAYPSPYNELHQHSLFAALIPGTKNYLVYHGGDRPAEILSQTEAIKGGYLPLENNGINTNNGAESQQGYMLVPNDWYMHAHLLNKDYEEIKPAKADFTGMRTAALA